MIDSFSRKPLTQQQFIQAGNNRLEKQRCTVLNLYVHGYLLGRCRLINHSILRTQSSEQQYVSRRLMTKDEFDRQIPINPPIGRIER